MKLFPHLAPVILLSTSCLLLSCDSTSDFVSAQSSPKMLDVPQQIKDSAKIHAASIELKDELNASRDPSYIPEFDKAYETGILLLDLEVQEHGKYTFDLNLLAPSSSGRNQAFKLDFTRQLNVGQQRLSFPIPVQLLTKKKGLLWSWIPEHRSEISINLSRLITPAEIESLTGVNLDAEIQKLRESGTKEKYLEELRVPHDKEISHFVGQKQLSLNAAPVMRTIAK